MERRNGRQAGWPIARQDPRCEQGTGFATIEDESGEVQCVLWPWVFARYRRALCGYPVVGPRSENFATQALRRLVRVRIRGADPPMQFVHENDLLSALELCLLKPVPGVFNVTGEGTVAYSELVRVTGARCVTLPAPVLAFLAQASWALRLQSDAPAAGLAMARWPWVASHEKLTHETGFRPGTPRGRHCRHRRWQRTAGRHGTDLLACLLDMGESHYA